MAHLSLQLEQIIDLAEELRLAGFDLGTQQYVAAQDLLLALAAHQQLPSDAGRLRTLLAPIFCSSPGEQEEFYRRFAAWLKRHPELESGADVPFINSTVDAATSSQAATHRAHWLRRPASLAALCLLVLLTMGAGYLALPVNYTLAGQVFSGEDGRALADAQVAFFNGQTKTHADGSFSLSYRSRNFQRLFQKQQAADLTISHNEHEPLRSQLRVHQPAPQNITLQKRQAVPETPQEEATSDPERAPTPVPVLLNNNPVPSNPSSQSSSAILLRALLAAAPLLLFAMWWLWRWWRRRALLQKLEAAGDPQLNRIRVKGAADLLFHSQAFRRAVQELRRHRQVAIKDLDIAATVRATIGQGGMFTPRYGSRKASPEYLLLIDRANLNDEQARFGEEVARRLEAGGVFVDRYYFQNDPRTCRLREPHSPLLTLPELAARHPEHQLLIFSDGAGFISPITGEPEHWLPLLDHWPRRVLLTPELAAADDDRELALAEQDFLILPATAEGLAALTEALAAGIASKPSSNGHARPFPRLILERPKRWLERNTPRPSVVNELYGQLRQYLGEDGWQWLAACAVYPTVSWDVTLYLGYKLLGRSEEFERQLLSLVRLPWFRYGTMPDWLRLRLIESFTPAQEQAVRRALEDLLLSALDRPQAGVELEFAAPVEPPADRRAWWQALRAKWAAWRRRRRLGDLLKNEPPESPLRDYVFLGFFSGGGGANQLTVNLPEVLRRALFPQGKAVLGLRTATALLAALSLAAPGAYLLYRALQPAPSPLVTSDFYQQMSREEQTRFVSEKVNEVLPVLRTVGNDIVVDANAIASIQRMVDAEALRVGNGLTQTGYKDEYPSNEDLSFVFARGIAYAPIIAREFSAAKAPPTFGLYFAMITSEFNACLKDSRGYEGIFRLGLGKEFADLDKLGAQTPCDVAAASSVVAKLIAIQTNKGGSFPVLRTFDFIAAAIVGENPRRFGLQMEPLSSYAKIAEPVPTPTPAISPKPVTSPKSAITPRLRVTPTPVAAAIGCDNTVAKGQRIRSVELQSGNGATEDIGNEYPLGPLFIGKLYQPGDDRRIKAEAQSLLAARKVDSSAVRVCVRIISCRAIEGCVEIYLQVPSPRPNQNPKRRPPTATDTPATTTPSAQIEPQANAPAPQQQAPMSNSNAAMPASAGRILARSPRDGMTARAQGAAVILQDAKGGQDLATLKGHTARITSAAFSPSGDLLATGSDDKTVKLWDIAGQREVATLTGATSTVSSIAFAPNGRSLAVSSFDNTVTVWDVSSYRQLAKLYSGARVYVVLFSPVGDMLVAGGEDGVLSVWNSANWQVARQIKAGAPIDNLIFQRNSFIRLYGTGNKYLGMWSVTTGEQLEKGR